jgi:steroid 5-alpha reductase family enzyme
MNTLKQSRFWSFIIMAFVYILAGWLAYDMYQLAALWTDSWVLQWLFADVVATIDVWAWGLILKNVSVYDPYWSVFPPFLLTVMVLVFKPISMATILLLIVVWLWAIRLTGNWAFTFKNLNSEDWRYTKYRTEQKPWIFHIINFFGLNMVPTLVVFLALLPGMEIVENKGLADANIFTWIGFAVALAAVAIELIADTQRHRFAKTHAKKEVCNVGLWKHGRHPNYFGEISFWWGIWLMFVSVNQFQSHVWYVVGPISMTCLFLFISIPLMEKRQMTNKTDYAAYKAQTRILI